MAEHITSDNHWDHIYSTNNTRLGPEIEADARKLAASLDRNWADLNAVERQSYCEAVIAGITPDSAPDNTLSPSGTVYAVYDTYPDSHAASGAANQLQGQHPEWHVRAALIGPGDRCAVQWAHRTGWDWRDCPHNVRCATELECQRYQADECTCVDSNLPASANCPTCRREPID